MPATAMRSKAHLKLDLLLGRIHDETRLLPALIATHGSAERRRLTRVLEQGAFAVPRYEITARRSSPEILRCLGEARSLAARVPGAVLYLQRLEELSLDLEMLESLGDPRRVRPLSRRRFGTGGARVQNAAGHVTVADVAAAILSSVAPTGEPRTLPADGPPGTPSLAQLVRRIAAHAKLPVAVSVEPRLVAAAAAGDREVFIADRRFGVREALRLAVHEVLGHLVSAANGRAQPLRLAELGCAGSFTDQEGVALWLEEKAGVLDGSRLRTLAARVVATDLMHDGADFGVVARRLVRDHGFAADEAVVICERAYRGGGVARDASYLRGWLRVRGAIATGEATLDELRSGRVSLGSLPVLRALEADGLHRPSVYRPSLAYSLGATDGGTSWAMSPPSFAASFTMFDET